MGKKLHEKAADHGEQDEDAFDFQGALLNDIRAGTNAADRDPAMVAAALALERAISTAVDLSLPLRAGTAIVIEVPEASWVEPIAAVWCETALAGGPPVFRVDAKSRWNAPPTGAALIYSRDGSNKWHTPANGNNVLAAGLLAGSCVTGISQAPERHLPRDLLRVADHRIAVPPMDPGLLVKVIVALAGTAPTSKITDDLARHCDLGDLRLAWRPGETGEQFGQRLLRLLKDSTRGSGITLDNLAGMDEATEWGKALAADLQEYRAGRLPWSAVDRGALVFGPPGTGKTTLARALAASCEVPLILGSLGEWQAAGHLGDLLKAMRAAFDRARAFAPAILFIDEVDSFGDRGSFSHENKNYSIQVVNGFLELLDGVAGREGVVVGGACNHPGRLDPAIVRSGRLDRRIHIPLPDQAALRQIIRHHLSTDLANADLIEVAKLSMGSTGADVERWVRGARRRARAGNRPMVIEDLLAEIRGNYSPLPTEHRRRTALHEAGHAVAIARLRPQALVRATIRPTDTTGGGVEITVARGTLSTRADFDQLLVHLLAGRAAEEVLLGSISAGAGGDEESDLARATALATTTSSS